MFYFHIVIKKILLLSATPSDTDRLHLNKELKEIKEDLRHALKREGFVIENAEAVQLGDLRHVLLDHEPQTVPFSHFERLPITSTKYVSK